MSVNLPTPVGSGLVLRLTRLAYQHVRQADDTQHNGSYSPDARDHAEQGRDAILNALLDTNGMDGWNAKLAMIDDPLFAHFKDRVIALARERSAEDSDDIAFEEEDVLALYRYNKLPRNCSPPVRPL